MAGSGRATLALAGALGAALAGAGIGGLAVSRRSRPPATERLHVQVVLPDLLDSTQAAISPDGRRLAFVAREPDGRSVLWIRPLGAPAAIRLAGTEGALAPFWSPDSRAVGFLAEKKLRRIDPTGGPVQVICDAAGPVYGASWGRGTVVFSLAPGELQRVAATGGAAVPVYPDEKGAPNRLRPSFLPDGRRFLFLEGPSTGSLRALHAGSLDGPERTRVAEASSVARYAPPGFLLFLREGTLMGQRFDLGRTAVSGEPFALAENVALVAQRATSGFSVSDTGILVYGSVVAPREQLVWFDRHGNRLGDFGEPGWHHTLDLAPDGRRVIFGANDFRTGAGALWLIDGTRAVTSMIAASPSANDPVFAPDGQRVAYTVRGRKPAIVEQPLAGGERKTLLELPGLTPVIEDWSPDGRYLAFRTTAEGSGPSRGALLPLSGERRPIHFAPSARDVEEIQFSPDGKWIAYAALESDRWEIYLAAVPPTDERWQISTGGGVQPRWRGDGRELFYLGSDGILMAAEVRPGPPPESGSPRALFNTGLRSPQPSIEDYLVAPDGEQFLVDLPANRPEDMSLTLVVSWAAPPAGAD